METGSKKHEISKSSGSLEILTKYKTDFLGQASPLTARDPHISSHGGAHYSVSKIFHS